MTTSYPAGILSVPAGLVTDYLRFITRSAAQPMAITARPDPAGDEGVVSVGNGVNIFIVVGLFVGIFCVDSVDIVDMVISGDSGIATRAVDTIFLPVSASSIFRIFIPCDGVAGIVPFTVILSCRSWYDGYERYHPERVMEWPAVGSMRVVIPSRTMTGSQDAWVRSVLICISWSWGNVTLAPLLGKSITNVTVMAVPGAWYPGGSTFTEETMYAETQGVMHAKSKKNAKKNLDR
jgi:hypothetical protein